MATDNRRILRGVRIGAETVTDPDKLDEMATPAEIAYLKTKGYIEGNFRGTKKAKSEETKQ